MTNTSAANGPVVPMAVPRQHACHRCPSHRMSFCVEIDNRLCDLCKAHSEQFLLICGKCDVYLCDSCYGLLYWLPGIEKLPQPVSQEAVAELTQRLFMGKKDLTAIISAGLGMFQTWRSVGYADALLRRAVENNEMRLIKLLVDAGVDTMRGHTESIFQLAAEVGNIESIQVVLGKYEEGLADLVELDDTVIAGLAAAARAGNVACAYAIWKHVSCQNNSKQKGVDAMVVGFIQAGLELEAESLILFENSIDDALGLALCSDVVELIEDLAGLPTGNPMANNCEAIKQAAVHGMWGLIDVMLESKLIKFEHVLTATNAAFVGACEGGHVTQVSEYLKSEFVDGFDMVQAFKTTVKHTHADVIKLLLKNKQCGQVITTTTEAVGVTQDLGVARVLSESASINRATHVKQYNLACTLGSLELVMAVLKSNKLEPSDVANGVILLVGSSDESTDTPVPALAYILSHPLYKQHLAVSPIQEEVLKIAVSKAPQSVVRYLLNEHTFDTKYFAKLRRKSLQNDDAGVAWCLLQALPEDQRGNAELEAILAHAIDRMDFALIAHLLGSKDGQDPNVPDLNDPNNNNNILTAVCDSKFAFENAISKRMNTLVKMLLTLDNVDPSKDDNAAFRYAIREQRWNCAMVLINDNRINPGANNNEDIKNLSKVSKYIQEDDMEIVENLLKFMLNDENVDVVAGMYELIKADCVFGVKLFGMCVGCPRVDLWAAVEVLEEALVWSGNTEYVYCIMNHSRALNCVGGVGKVEQGQGAQKQEQGHGQEGQQEEEEEIVLGEQRLQQQQQQQQQQQVLGERQQQAQKIEGQEEQEQEQMLKKRRLQQDQGQQQQEQQQAQEIEGEEQQQQHNTSSNDHTCIKDVCLHIFQRMKQVDMIASKHAISAAREYCVWVLGDVAVDSDDEESHEEKESNEMASVGGPVGAAAKVEGQETSDDKEKVEKTTKQARINHITASKVRGGHPAMFPGEEWPYHQHGRRVRCMLLFQINLSDAPKLIQEHVKHYDGLYQVFHASTFYDSYTFVRHIPVSDFGVLVRGECPFDIHTTPGCGRRGDTYADYSERAIVGWVIEKDYPATCCSLICSGESEKDARFGSVAMNKLVAKKWNAWSVFTTFGDKFGGYYWHGNSGYTGNCLGGEVDSDEDAEEEPKLGVFMMNHSVKGKHASIFHEFGAVLRLVGDKFERSRY